jgi:hypothetical protein
MCRPREPARRLYEWLKSEFHVLETVWALWSHLLDVSCRCVYPRVLFGVNVTQTLKRSQEFGDNINAVFELYKRGHAMLELWNIMSTFWEYAMTFEISVSRWPRFRKRWGVFEEKNGYKILTAYIYIMVESISSRFNVLNMPISTTAPINRWHCTMIDQSAIAIVP